MKNPREKRPFLSLTLCFNIILFPRREISVLFRMGECDSKNIWVLLALNRFITVVQFVKVLLLASYRRIEGFFIVLFHSFFFTGPYMD